MSKKVGGIFEWVPETVEGRFLGSLVRALAFDNIIWTVHQGIELQLATSGV